MFLPETCSPCSFRYDFEMTAPLGAREMAVDEEWVLSMMLSSLTG